jgi:hypothetical protein
VTDRRVNHITRLAAHMKLSPTPIVHPTTLNNDMIFFVVVNIMGFYPTPEFQFVLDADCTS